MGISSDGILAYGFDLGSEESPLVKEFDEDEYRLQVDWYNDGDDDEEGFQYAALKRLLDANGLPDDNPYSRERVVKDKLGVEMVVYCTFDIPSWVLAAKHYTVSRGSVQVLTAEDLTVDPTWEPKLRSALEALGLTPEQEKPEWLLVSLMG